MEIIQHELKEVLKLPSNFTSLYNDTNFAIFDIETTGLNPKFHNVILIGLLYEENNNLVLQQFFCNTRREEAELLSAFKEKIKEFDLLISYNGNSFDIPFLNKRFLANHIDYSINNCKSVDILNLIRKVHKNLNLTNYKLKSVEKYLGIFRNDTISGKESVSLYNQFEKEQNQKLKDLILLHNYDDLYYLNKSLIILDKNPIEQVIESFPQIIHGRAQNLCYITKKYVRKNILYLEGSYKAQNLNDYIFYEDGFNFEYIKESHSFIIKIPLYKGALSSGSKCLYIDTQDFSFPYNKICKDYTISKNIIIFKEDNVIKTLEIYSFAKALVSSILKKIENIA